MLKEPVRDTWSHCEAPPKPTDELLESRRGGGLRQRLLGRLAQSANAQAVATEAWSSKSSEGLLLWGKIGRWAGHSRTCKGGRPRSWAKEAMAQRSWPHVNSTCPGIVWAGPL